MKRNCVCIIITGSTAVLADY